MSELPLRNRVVFVIRSDFRKALGGDSVQALSTAKYLERLGYKVLVVGSNAKVDLRNFDILHLFNVIRPNDLLHWLDDWNGPVFLSTIFVEYTFNNGKKSILSRLTEVFGSDFGEYVKNVIKMLLGKSRPFSFRYLLLGHRLAVRCLIRRATLLLPNSESEQRRLSQKYGFHRYRKIPNGIDLEIFGRESDFDSKQFQNSIVCVGRIEPIKNQLNVILALSGLSIPVFFVGAVAPNHSAYYQQCVASAGSNIRFIGSMEQKDLVDVLRVSRVHVLASHFETTGLVSLEAAYMGCNIVVTNRGDQYEYFHDFAWFCDPNDIVDIRSKVLEAYHSERNYYSPQERIRTYYSWDAVAKETSRAYRSWGDK